MSNPMQSEREKLIEHIGQMVAGDYTCERVWEAWQYGTMTQDDFAPLNETERVEELADYILQREQEARTDELHKVNKAGYVSRGYMDKRLSELAALTTKSTTKTLDLHKAGRGKPDGNHEAFTVVEEPNSTEPSLDPGRDFGPGGILGSATPQDSTASKEQL